MRAQGNDRWRPDFRRGTPRSGNVIRTCAKNHLQKSVVEPFSASAFALHAGTPRRQEHQPFSLGSLQIALYLYCQGMTTTISSKGQITVPVGVREALGLVSGTKIELRLGTNGTFVARKASEGSFFARFQGMGKKVRVPYRDSREALDILRGPVEKGDLE